MQLVAISFKKEENFLHINYSDNGLGASLNEINFKNGLQNVENRILAQTERLLLTLNPIKDSKSVFQFQYNPFFYVSKSVSCRRFRLHQYCCVQHRENTKDWTQACRVAASFLSSSAVLRRLPLVERMRGGAASLYWDGSTGLSAKHECDAKRLQRVMTRQRKLCCRFVCAATRAVAGSHQDTSACEAEMREEKGARGEAHVSMSAPERMKFSGLTSPCSTPRSWQCATLLAICKARRAAVCSGTGPCTSSQSWRATPEQRSITMCTACLSSKADCTRRLVHVTASRSASDDVGGPNHGLCGTDVLRSHLDIGDVLVSGHATHHLDLLCDDIAAAMRRSPLRHGLASAPLACFSIYRHAHGAG